MYFKQLSMQGCSVVWYSCVCRMVDDRVVVNVNDGSPLYPPSKFRGEPRTLVLSVHRHCACQVLDAGHTVKECMLMCTDTQALIYVHTCSALCSSGQTCFAHTQYRVYILHFFSVTVLLKFIRDKSLQPHICTHIEMLHRRHNCEFTSTRQKGYLNTYTGTVRI